MPAEESMETGPTSMPTASSHNALEQFVLLAKGVKGAAIHELIRQVLEAPGVHVFGELLAMPNVMELEGSSNAKALNTLNIFAYGTYKQYLEDEIQMIKLTPAMKKKLQHLTIVTLAIKSKCIPYSTLLEELDIKNVRDLEDLIIEAIYSDIVHGKLDQKKKQLEVDNAIGRDIRPNNVHLIGSTLQDWCDSCESVLACIEDQINRANNEKVRRLKHKEKIETDITNLKKTLKNQVIDLDEPMTTDLREAISGQELLRRKNNKKTARASGRNNSNND